MRRSQCLSLVAVIAIAAACGGNPEPEQPAPQPEPEVAVNQDSIDAENERRRAEEEARRRAEEERLKREMEAGRASLVTDLTTPIHFDYDQATVRSNDQAVLDRKAAILQANPSLQIRVSGHADERGSDEYNLALGNRRAAAAKRYLQNQGVEAGRVEVISFGEERPVAEGADEGSYAQNRRDEFEPTGGGDDLRGPQ